MCIIFPTALLYGDTMIWSGRTFTTDGIKVRASVRSVYWHCTSVLPFQVQVRAQRGTVWRRMMTDVFLKWNRCQVGGFSKHTALLFLNGSTWAPWGAHLHSEECLSWSLQHKNVLWKCKYDEIRIQPGPESSQDTSLTCRHRELWWFSGEQAGVLLACDDDGLTQPALACGGQLKTTPRS